MSRGIGKQKSKDPILLKYEKKQSAMMSAKNIIYYCSYAQYPLDRPARSGRNFSSWMNQERLFKCTIAKKKWKPTQNQQVRIVFPYYLKIEIPILSP